jgi:hypothetical protein
VKIENTLKFAALLAAGAAFVSGQTQVDLRTQSKTGSLLHWLKIAR